MRLKCVEVGPRAFSERFFTLGDIYDATEHEVEDDTVKGRNNFCWGLDELSVFSTEGDPESPLVARFEITEEN